MFGLWKLAMLIVIQIFPEMGHKPKKKRRWYAPPLGERQKKLLDLYMRMVQHAKDNPDTED